MKTEFAVGLLITFVTGCGGSGSPASSDPQWSVIDGTAGSAAAPSESTTSTKRWSGIESCKGSDGDKEIDKSSAETSIDSFTKTRAAVTIAGVRVGPNSEYSCVSPLKFDGIITMATSDQSSMFESAGDDVAHQQSCNSATNKQLAVGWLDGYDTDLRTLDGPWDLHFDVRIAEPIDLCRYRRWRAGIPKEGDHVFQSKPISRSVATGFETWSF